MPIPQNNEQPFSYEYDGDSNVKDSQSDPTDPVPEKEKARHITTTTHEGSITALTYSPNGEFVASAAWQDMERLTRTAGQGAGGALRACIWT